MSLTLNPESYEIRCPTGDTGLLLVEFNDGDGQPLPQPLDGVAVFAVCQQINGAYAPVKERIVDLVNNTATVNITNAFSRAIPAGNYFWDIRVVTSPVIDEDGNVRTDADSDEVHSIFAGSATGMPKYVVPGVASNV